MIDRIFDELYSINREIDRMFREYDINENRWGRANIYENNDGYVIVAKLPGVKKEDINLTIKDNVLKISGEKKKEEHEKSNTLLNERFAGKFERSFILNEKIDTDNIVAEMKNGLLMIKLNKSPESKPKLIEIK